MEKTTALSCQKVLHVLVVIRYALASVEGDMVEGEGTLYEDEEVLRSDNSVGAALDGEEFAVSVQSLYCSILQAE